jgi:hypothetical protein
MSRRLRIAAVGGGIIGVLIVAALIARLVTSPTLDNSPGNDLAIRLRGDTLDVVVLSSCSVIELRNPDLRVGNSIYYEDLRRVASSIEPVDVAEGEYVVKARGTGWPPGDSDTISLTVRPVFTDREANGFWGVEASVRDARRGASNAGVVGPEAFDLATERCGS